jgi:hypothetical protein
MMQRGESQLRTRVKIEGTKGKTVFEEFKRINALEIEKAETEDNLQPAISLVVEMPLRKVIKTYKTEKK